MKGQGESYASYVPALIARQFARESAPPTEARAERLTGAVLFADISGFTALTESLARRGPRGAEELTQCLNVYFGQLIDLMTDHGGDVLKFAGDALLAFWPVGSDDLQLATGRAAQCALAAQERLHNFPAAADVRLSLRIGIGAGSLSLLHVGGVNGRWEIVVTGAALTQMGPAKEQGPPGDVTLSPEAWALIQDRAIGRPLIGGAGCVQSLSDRLPPALRQPPPADGARALLAYLPPAVVHHLESEQTGWLAELRPVTVLFVNFPGLTPLTPLDRAQAVMRDLQTILYRHEATINKLSVDDKGASLVAALGLPPLAHEDDAARGVRAALAIRDHLREMDVRHAIGMTTGLTFCGVIGNTTRREYTMIGDVVNLAARLMQAAPDDVLCDQATYEASRSRLVFEALPAIHVKGKAAPIAVYRPQGAARMTATRAGRVGALVGRRLERHTLEEMLRGLVADGTGGTAVLEGEAGIGKSRLIEELIGRAREAGVDCLVGAGDAMEKSTPYYAWRGIFDQLLDLEPGLTREQRRARTAERVHTGPYAWEPLMPLLNPVLLTDFAETGATSSLRDRARAAATHDFLADLSGGLSHTGSRKLVVLEDTHWMDSPSWQLAAAFSRRQSSPLMVLAVRPAGGPPPEELEAICAAPGTRRMPIQRLSDDEAIEVAGRTLEVAHLPDPVERMIREKAEGNPLFIEELAHTLREAGLVQIVGGECRLAPAAGDLRSVDLPDTVHGAVMARIDRLSPSQRMLLKVASVVGRTFERDIVERLHPAHLDATSIVEDLDALTALQITGLQRPDPTPAYTFTQLIFQEVSYNLMLFSQRRQLHRAMAEWLEGANAGELGRVYPSLATHWSRAVEGGGADPAIVSKAVDYLQRAGDQAVGHYANREAVAFLNDGLRLLHELPDTAERAQRELRLCCAVGAPLIATRGFAAPEIERAYARAWELCQALDDSPERFEALLGLWVFYLVKTELRRAREMAEELVRSAAASGITDLLLPAHRAMGDTSFWLGELTSARQHLERAVELYRPEHHAAAARRNAQDPGVVCRVLSAWTLWLLGYPDAALARMVDGLALADDLRHPHSVAMALQNFAMTHQFRGEAAAAKDKAERLIELSHAEGFALWLAGGVIMRGWALCELGQADLGRAEMRRGIDDWGATGALLPVGYYLSLLAAADGEAGEPEKGLDLVTSALAASAASAEAWWKPELWRLRAELALQLPSPDEGAAEDYLHEALDLASRQSARSLELRAAASLFRLRRKQGREVEARPRLAQVWEWFGEGHETADLKEAARLLDR